MYGAVATPLPPRRITWQEVPRRKTTSLETFGVVLSSRYTTSVISTISFIRFYICSSLGTGLYHFPLPFSLDQTQVLCAPYIVSDRQSTGVIAHLLYESRGDGVESIFALFEELDSELLIHISDSAERRSAELHATFDNAGAVRSSNPVCCAGGDLMRNRPRVLHECHFVIPQAELGILGGIKVIQ